MIKNRCFLLIFSLLLIQSNQIIYDLVKLNTTSALCLDGSPYSYYLSRQGNHKKILLLFEGGGWCGYNQGFTQQLVISDCYQRSKTRFGSSIYYKNKLQFTDNDDERKKKEYFQDWKKVFINYCDGSSHQGFKKQPIVYKDTKLYFRGHNNTIQMLQSLQQKIKIFSQATHVVVGGGSAGGLAVYFWVDYIASRVKTGKVWGLPDSGIFVDFNHIKYNRPIFEQIYGNIMKVVNIQVDIPVSECMNEFKQQKFKCFFAQNLINHIKTPLFFLQPLYDSWSILYILGIQCIYRNEGSVTLLECNNTQVNFIEQYHQKMKNIITQNIQKNKKNGLWAPACINHQYGIYNSYFSHFRINDFSANQAIKNWIEDADNKLPQKYQIIDRVKWPKNHSCNDLSSPALYVRLILIVIIGWVVTSMIIISILCFYKYKCKYEQNKIQKQNQISQKINT